MTPVVVKYTVDDSDTIMDLLLCSVHSLSQVSDSGIVPAKLKIEVFHDFIKVSLNKILSIIGRTQTGKLKADRQ